MPLDILNRGQGFIGPIASGWGITQGNSPAILGDRGSFGQLSFTAACDGTTKFTIDNYLSVMHFFDDHTTRWLATFDGYIREVKTNSRIGQFTVSPLATALDVERVARVDMFGTYQRSFEMPVGQSYVANSTTYFVPAAPEIYDLVSTAMSVFVLCKGGHNGEIVIEFGVTGDVKNLWPVWSDATDLASPWTRYITYADGFIWVGQEVAARIKKFTASTGVFHSQFGSSGTGNGQFTTIRGLAATAYGSGELFVADELAAAPHRVQRFSKTSNGYISQWSIGAAYEDIGPVSIDPIDQFVWVGAVDTAAGAGARVESYSQTGTIDTSSRLGGNGDTDEFPTLGSINMQFDHLGNGYAAQDGRLYKYIRPVDDSWSTLVPHFFLDIGTTDANPTHLFTVSPDTGLIHVARNNLTVEQYSGSMGNLTAYILYYIALAADNFPVRFVDWDSVSTPGEWNFISWEGNVWKYLSDLCAVAELSMFSFGEHLVFMPRGSRNLLIPDDSNIDPIDFDSRGAGQSVELVNYNSRYTVGDEIMWDSRWENRRVFSLNNSETLRVTVSGNTYPEHVYKPSAALTNTAPGTYVIYDKNGAIVSSSWWFWVGASFAVEVGEVPGTINITMTGPSQNIPLFEAPYEIRHLSILGTGVICNPETISVGTGIETVTRREVAQTIDCPFVQNSELAYTQGSWAAYVSGTPGQEISITIPTHNSPAWLDTGTEIDGTMLLVGTIVHHDDAQYMIDSVSYDEKVIKLKGYRYTKTALGVETGTGISMRFEELWQGTVATQFDAYWAGYTAQDFTIAPLRFG